MDEIISQGGELLIGIMSAFASVSAVMLLLGQTDAGVLRDFLVFMLEAAC